MNVYKLFLKTNGLKQMELAKFLNITNAAVSNIVNGKANLSEDNLIKLLENGMGWDISMFSESQSGISAGDHSVIVAGNGKVGDIDARRYYSDSPDVLRAQIELLDERIKEKDAQIKEKDAQIKEKDAQIKQLLDILAKR